MTINDIARLAGVSTATVSRVINDTGQVKPETREIVLNVIKENNFVPSAVARSLSVRTTANIGVIFPDIENAFFIKAFRGITDVAEQNNFNVLFLNSDESVAKEQSFIKTVKGEQLAGIIISPVDRFAEETEQLLEKLEDDGIPVVLLDRDIRGGDFSIVLAENEKGAYLATEELIKEGHEKIALIEGNSAVLPVYERSKGYRQALDDYDIPVRGEYMVRASQKSELAYYVTEQLLALPDPPTAIFTNNNMMTIGCLRYLTEHDLRAGRDISLIGFDDIDVLNSIGFNLSVVNRSEVDMGKAAMTMLLERMEDRSGQAKTVILPVELILRGSEKLGV